MKRAQSLTNALTEPAGIYKALAYAGTWGISALSKMPNLRIDFGNSERRARRRDSIICLAMLYHGVRTEEAVLMRMNSVREALRKRSEKHFTKVMRAQPGISEGDLRNMTVADWSAAKPSQL